MGLHFDTPELPERASSRPIHRNVMQASSARRADTQDHHNVHLQRQERGIGHTQPFFHNQIARAMK